MSPQPETFTAAGQQIDLSLVEQVTTDALNPASNTVGSAIFRLQSADQNAYLMMVGNVVIENTATDSQSPMQSFRFQTTSSGVGCDEIDAMLAIYVPDGPAYTFDVNDAVLQIQGLVTMQWNNVNSLSVTVHSGTLTIPDTGIITAGQTIAAITDAGSILVWSAPYPATSEQLQRERLIADAMQQLTDNNIVSDASIANDPVQESADDTCENSPIHTVERGENLYRIALRYGVTEESIVDANQLANPRQIITGQQLVIPCGVDSSISSLAQGQPAACGDNVIHTVSRGETLFQIAQRYGTSVDAIMTANGISDPRRIHEGNQFVIPCSTGASAPVTTQPDPSNPDFCATFFELAPPDGYSQQMIEMYNQLCT